MKIDLFTTVNEKSTLPIEASFTDEDGAAVTPSSITWTLTDHNGNVINNREDVSATPGETVTILLSGDDLAIGSNGRVRVLTVEALYNSTLGNDLPLKEEIYFSIKDLVNVG
jgi:hypothetical protein